SAAVLLSARAARKAVVESPYDLQPYLHVYEAYGLLRRHEDYWAGLLRPTDIYKPPTVRLRFRHAQTVAALHHAGIVQPDNWLLHKDLGELYLSLRYLDLGAEQLMLARQQMLVRGAVTKDQEDLKRQFNEQYGDLKPLQEELKKQQDNFKAAATGQPDPFARFLAAIYAPNPEGKGPGYGPRGLVQAGLSILLDPKLNVSKLDAEKVQQLMLWRFTLQLLTGKAREANSDLQEEAAKKVLPPVEYHELRAMAAAALGDYATADKHLELADKALALPPDEQLVEGQKKPTRQMLEVMVATA